MGIKRKDFHPINRGIAAILFICAGISFYCTYLTKMYYLTGLLMIGSYIRGIMIISAFFLLGIFLAFTGAGLWRENPLAKRTTDKILISGAAFTLLWALGSFTKLEFMDLGIISGCLVLQIIAIYYFKLQNRKIGKSS